MKTKVKSARISESHEAEINRLYGSFSNFVTFSIERLIETQKYLIAIKGEVFEFKSNRARLEFSRKLKSQNIQHVLI